MVKATSRLFEVEEPVDVRPRGGVPEPVVEASEEDLTPLAGVALWGPLLDRLGLVGLADDVGLRQVAANGFSGGECLRALVETMLAGGDFLTDVELLRDDATSMLRGGRALPSHDTLWRFCDEATDLGRVAKAGKVLRRLIARAWGLGAAPDPGVLTIDPDATLVQTFGPTKQGCRFGYVYGQVGLSPVVGVFAETGEICAVRNRGGNANPGRGIDSFVDECVSAIPKERRGDYQLWIRVDSAGYSKKVVGAAERHQAWFSITAKRNERVCRAIYELHTDPDTVWRRAKGDERRRGSQIAECDFVFAGRTLRLVVRRQPVGSNGDAQLSFDDVDGWRFHAIITNITRQARTAVNVEAHHRARGGVPEDAIRQAKNDFGLNHAPLSNFFGNAVWQHAAALSYNTVVWLKRLALPDHFARSRGKRLRLQLLNVAARVVRHARRLHLKFARGYRWVDEFAAALARLHALPAFR